MNHQGAMAVLLEAASRIDPPAITQWREGGRPIVGTTCSLVPPEVLYAAGVLPVRLRGLSARGGAVGDAYFGPFICSFPKCLLQLAGSGALSFLDGVVITPGCDAMRRLHECWRKAGEDIPGRVPPFFHYFDVPHKAEGHGLSWFIDELNTLISLLSSHFSVHFGEPELRAAVAVYDQGRILYEAMDSFLLEDRPRVSGAEVFAVAIAGSILPREEYAALLSQALEEVRLRPAAAEGAARIVVSGSMDDSVDFMRLVEEGGRAVVVGETLCFGSRIAGGRVEGEGNPVEAIARRYLNDSLCPRMFGGYAERLRALCDLVESRRADGVILQNIRFCDMHGSENGLMARDLGRLGVPVLRLEREYGPMSDTARIKLRLDAFLEQLKARRTKDARRRASSTSGASVPG